jgi:hypothetical protein
VRLSPLILTLCLAGCSSGKGWNPFGLFSGGTTEEVARLPSDPTQAQVALWVAGPLGATAALLLLSGVVMWWMGAGVRAFQSIAFGVALIVVNGFVIFFLKSKWTMLIIAISAGVTVLLLYLDARDGTMFWVRKKALENGEPPKGLLWASGSGLASPSSADSSADGSS